MSDLIADGVAWLNQQLNDHAAKTVTIQTADGLQSCTADATVSVTMYEADNGAGIIDRWQSRDFLIDADQWKPTGSVTLPVRGQRIVEVIGATTCIFEVNGPRDTPHFDYADGFRGKLLVHTQQVPA